MQSFQFLFVFKILILYLHWGLTLLKLVLIIYEATLQVSVRVILFQFLNDCWSHTFFNLILSLTIMNITNIYLKIEGTEEYDVRSITSADSHPKFHSPK